MHAFSPPFPLLSSVSSSINLIVGLPLVNGDLKQALKRQSRRVAYMMSVEGGKVKVTSSTVMKTNAARVQ